jgi:glycosyltransferase involved in cell wall biosynthesis
VRQPTVSVIIPTRDRPRLLDAAVRSVAAQNLDGSVEAIIVNDGGESVASLLGPWEDLLPVKLIELEHGAGPGAARNIGIELAESDHLAFLDDDDLFLSGHLATGCEQLERGVADLVYLGAVVAPRRLYLHPTDLASFTLKAYAYDPRFLLVANFVHTGSVIVRNFRHAPVRFDETLDVCEDWDLWLALTISLGYRPLFIDDVTSVYHQVPDVPGLVARAQQVSPSRFALARDYIQAKWPARDPLVCAHREWMVAFERRRSELIASHQPMPNLLFDEVLAYVHGRMSREQAPDQADLGQFFVLSSEDGGADSRGVRPRRPARRAG